MFEELCEFIDLKRKELNDKEYWWMHENKKVKLFAETINEIVDKADELRGKEPRDWTEKL